MSDDLTPDEAEIEASRAPLLDHLVELRRRLIVCVAALIVGFGVCFAFADNIYTFLLEPFVKAGALIAAQHAGLKHGPFDLIEVMVGLKEAPDLNKKTLELIFTAPLEFFFTKMKMAGFGAVVLTFPILAWQLYAFVAPGLYRKERRAFLPFLAASPVLFTMGAALVYYIMLPFVMWFSLSQQVTTATVNVALVPKVSDYLTLVTTLLLAFGLCFQLPVVLSLAGLAGLVNSKLLREGRRYAIVVVFVIAAIFTPPDPISQLMLAIPICLLYEASIWCVWLIERRRKRDEAGTDIVVA
ncbi:MAG TPA: twin-arginine translocase subunit TatC [Caulobacter sp.]|nr:twin-arginine translocase subunit TatC [Caulobacter sp.]